MKPLLSLVWGDYFVLKLVYQPVNAAVMSGHWGGEEMEAAVPVKKCFRSL